MTDFVLQLLDLILIPFKSNNVIFVVPTAFCCVVGSFVLVKRMMRR